MKKGDILVLLNSSNKVTSQYLKVLFQEILYLKAVDTIGNDSK